MISTKIRNCFFFTLALAAVFFLAGSSRTFPVYGDAIAEPFQDSFYETHRNECLYSKMQVIANGPDGKVILYVSPQSSEIVNEVKNGTISDVQWFYMDAFGVRWLYYTPGRSWAPADYFLRVYDGDAFEDEFAESVSHEPLDVDLSQYTDTDIMFYTFPGSAEGSLLCIPENMLDVFAQFTDEEGRLWAYATLYYGKMKKWFCVDNPSASFEELYPNGAPVRGINSGAVIPINIRTPEDSPNGLSVGELINAPEPPVIDISAGFKVHTQFRNTIVIIACSVIAIFGIICIATVLIRRKSKASVTNSDEKA